MFDNIGTALVQAIGFFGVFGFFVYQLLSEDKNAIKTSITPPNNKNNRREFKNQNPESKKKGLFSRKSESAKEELKTKKKGLFGRGNEPSKDIEIPKKKGWFN